MAKSKYLYQIRLRSNEELDKLIKEYQNENEKNADACKAYGLGVPETVGKYPTRLVVDRYDLETKQMEEKQMDEVATETKYRLLFRFGNNSTIVEFADGGTPEEREEFKKEMNLNLTADEFVKIFRTADAEKIPKSAVDDCLTGLWRFNEANTIAKYNALKQGRTTATVEDCANVASELIELRKALDIKR